MTFQTVTSGGMQWTVFSRNERATEHEGRHFFACRCRPGSPWVLFEFNRSIIKHESAKHLREWRNNYEVGQLSDAVRAICKPLLNKELSQ